MKDFTATNAYKGFRVVRFYDSYPNDQSHGKVIVPTAAFIGVGRFEKERFNKFTLSIVYDNHIIAPIKFLHIFLHFFIYL